MSKFSIKCCSIKAVTLCLFSFLFSITGFSQRTNVLKDSAIERRLVELAVNGPRMKSLEHQNKLDEYQLKRAKDAWLNILSISGSLNDQTFAKNMNTVGNPYPKGSLGVTIPLGTLFSKTEVKAAREGIEMGKLNMEELRRTIKAEVISKYRQYKAYDELTSIQAELLVDVEDQLEETEEKFRKGTTTMEAYNNAQKGRNAERGTLINLKLQQDLVKIDIERIIGVSLESVIK